VRSISSAALRPSPSPNRCRTTKSVWLCGPDARAHDRPEVLHRPSRQTASPRAAGQPEPGLRAVEREVSALVLDDRVQEVDELGVLGLGDQAMVGREGRELVGGTPGHVQRDEVVHHGGSEHRADVAQLSLPAEPTADPLVPRQPGRVRGAGGHPFEIRRELPARLTQEPAERLTVPQLLVDPARQERGDVRLVGRRRREQVPEIDRGVGLDIHHVREAARLGLGDRVAPHALPGHAGEVDALGRTQVPVEVELLHLEGDSQSPHARMTEPHRDGKSGSRRRQATIVRSRLASFNRSAPCTVTTTWSSIRTPKRPSR